MLDDAVEVPADLEEQVRAYLEENPECPWEEAVAEIVRAVGSVLSLNKAIRLICYRLWVIARRFP
jgi:hypothetical protein